MLRPRRNGLIPETSTQALSMPIQGSASGPIDGSEGEKRSSSVLAAAVDLLQSPACLVSATGHIIRSNVAWRMRAALAGVGTGSMLWTQSIWPEDRSAAAAKFRSAVAAGRRTNIECRLLDNDSAPAPRWFLLDLQPANQVATNQYDWLCIAADIHALKCREIDLEKRASIQSGMLDVSVDCIKLIALDGALIHMNKAGCHALGVAEESGFGMPWLPLLPEDVQSIGEEALAIAQTGEFARFPGRSALPGQETQYWDNMLTPVIGEGGQPTAILCVSREVTAERKALESLQQSQERLTMAAEVGGLGIWDYDIEHDRLYCDKGWYRIMGRDSSVPVRSLSDFRPLIHPDDADRVTEVNRIGAELIAANRDYAIVFRIVRPDGDIRWVRSAACLIQGNGSVPARAVGFVVDITDARRGELALRDANRTLEEEKTSLVRQNLEDPLTGIANRRYLDRELGRICANTARTGEALCVGMIDVDCFKAFNDQYGHLEGDTALRRIASALHLVARQSDLVARYGGEEFAFVLTGLEDPRSVLDRFTKAVADLAIVHTRSLTGYLTVSCGCIVSDSNSGLLPAELLKAADEALYEAKATGRNRWIVRPFLAGRDGGGWE